MNLIKYEEGREKMRLPKYVKEKLEQGREYITNRDSNNPTKKLRIFKVIRCLDVCGDKVLTVAEVDERLDGSEEIKNTWEYDMGIKVVFSK